MGIIYGNRIRTTATLSSRDRINGCLRTAHRPPIYPAGSGQDVVTHPASNALTWD